MADTKGSKYEKELVDVWKSTKAKGIGFIIIDGDRGSSFDIRAVEEKYLRQLPQALIELASRMEGQFAETDMKRAAERLAESIDEKNSR